MSGLERARRYARKRRRQSAGGYLPILGSAVTGWLRLASGTITGAGYSSVPDLLNAANPAVQGTDGSRPANETSANGLPIANCDGTADNLSWPAASNTNSTAVGGVAFWFRSDSVAAVFRGVFTCTPGASNRYEVTRNGADILVDVHISQFSARRGTASAVLSAAAWQFVTFEFDGAGANDAAKCVITINGTPIVLSFSDGSGAPGAMPSALVVAVGDYFIGCRNSGGATGFNDGTFGPNIFVLGAKMTGATTGLLTTAGRAALMNLDAPT